MLKNVANSIRYSFQANYACLLACALLLVVGCHNEESPPRTSKKQPKVRVDVPLTVVVIGNTRLSDIVTKYAGDWQQAGGGAIKVVALPTGTSEAIGGDVVLFPHALLSEFTQKGRLAEVRTSVWQSKSFDAAGLLPIARHQLGRTPGRLRWLPRRSIPIAVPQWLWVQSKKIEAPSPTSWHGIARWSDDFSEGGAMPFIEALSGEHGAWALLRRVADSDAQGHQYFRLWSEEDFSPAITSPQFVRALEWLVSAHENEKAREFSLSANPQQALKAVSSGEALAAIAPVLLGKELRGGFLFEPLPTADVQFSGASKEWIVNSNQRGRWLATPETWLVAAIETSRHGAAAARLAAWLSSSAAGEELATAGGGPARNRDLLILSGNRSSSVSLFSIKSYKVATKSMANREELMLLPRVPEVESYLAALSTAVQQAVSRDLSAEEALKEAAEEFDEITERIGRNSQARAYASILTASTSQSP